MERSATAFTAADRIGQLAVQVNDIADSRRMLDAAAAAAPRPRRAPSDPLELGRDDALGGPRRRRRSRPRSGRSCAPTTPSCCRTTSQGTLHPRAAARTRPGCSPTTSSPRSSERLAAITVDDLERRRRGRPLGDRAAARRRRPEDPRRPLAQRPGRGRVPALRRRRVRARPSEALARVRARDPRPRRGRGGRRRCPATRTSSARSPVTLGHHLLAWVEMLERDRARFAFAAAQAAPSPLGAGALAGSTLPLPPPPDPMRNSLDAVADRDFALDYLYAVRGAASRTSRGSARSSCSGRRASSASRGCRRTRRPARR